MNNRDIVGHSGVFQGAEIEYEPKALSRTFVVGDGFEKRVTGR
jgi:hypothetical protein